MNRTREEILRIVTQFCVDNHLELCGNVEGDLVIDDKKSSDPNPMHVFTAIGPKGEL